MVKPVRNIGPISSIAICLIIIPWTAAPSVAASFAGTEVFGIAREIKVTCSGCPIPTRILSSTADGGVGSVSATVDFAPLQDVNDIGDPEDLVDLGLASYFATAGLIGPNSLPKLGTLGFGNIFVDLSQLSTFFHVVDADAKGTQQYLYTGANPGSYTLEYFLDGVIIGGPLSELFGGFSVFGSSFDPQNQILPILGSTSDAVRGIPGDIQNVLLHGSVTFDVSPGDSFYVVAEMTARANSLDENRAFVAAVNTLEMAFTAGDTSLLTPVAIPPGPGAAVPEPASAMLGGIGLILGGLLGRRRLGAARK